MTKVTHLTLEEGGGLNRRRIHLREISGEADSPLETVGQDLRAARQRRGDDLATVSRSLKIRKDHLEALEEDRFEALPGRTYAVGFTRAYADYLGLDPVQAVERFKREIAGRAGGAEPTAQGSMAPPIEERKLPHGWIIIAAVVLVVVGYGVYWLAMSADKMLNPTVAPVPVSLAPKPLAPKPKPIVLQPPPQAVTPATQDAANNTNPAATPAMGPDANGAAQTVPPAAPPMTLAQSIAALPPGNAYGAQNAGGRVVLHVREPARVVVTANDGTVYINRVLKPGDTYRVPDRVGVTLTTSDGSAVAIELDSQIMGTAGKRQVTEGLSLDPQAIFDRSGGTPGQ
ncbi:MAG TPA: RodZ domain-containing protein [Rhizomicrobium sp.]